MSSSYVNSGQYRYLRACMVCSIVQPQQVSLFVPLLPPPSSNTNPKVQKFIKEGCPNCEDAIHLRNNSEKVEDCTSPVFEGLIALWQPTQSWVSKWQRVDGFVRGMYAVKVSGNVSIPNFSTESCKPCFSLTFLAHVRYSFPRKLLFNWKTQMFIINHEMVQIPTIGIRQCILFFFFLEARVELEFSI